MQKLFIVFIGGGIGASLRYLSALLFSKYNLNFPFSTLFVNALGCFLIGFIISATIVKDVHTLRIFIIIGVLGGFTTYSTFSFETIYLFQQGKHLLAGLNIVLTTSICLLFTYFGTLVKI